MPNVSKSIPTSPYYMLGRSTRHYSSTIRKPMKTPIAVTLIIMGALLAMTPEAAISARSTTAAPAAILITDCGAEMDDQWALAHLLLSTELDLRAVITTHASSIRLSSARSAEEAAEVIRHVLPERASSLPVAARSSEPEQLWRDFTRKIDSRARTIP